MPSHLHFHAPLKMNYGQELAQKFAEEITGMKAITNYRPNWLGGLEIDIFFPELKLAIEFQGDQHYVPVYGRESLKIQKRNDIIKRQILISMGYAFLRINASHLTSYVLDKKIKNAGRLISVPMRQKFPCRDTLSSLDKASVKYRKMLKGKFASPSASQTRFMKKAKLAWRETFDPKPAAF